MKVLQVCAYAAQYGGNFIASLLTLDGHLESLGIQTMYLFPESAAQMPWCQQMQKIRKVYFAGMNRFSHKTYRQVKLAMKEADIIHSHFELYDCLCALAKKKHQKMFWHLHDSFDEDIDIAHRIINRVQYGFSGRHATLISPNRHYADYTVKLGFPAKQVRIVDNCIDCARLQSMVQKERKYDFFVFGGFYKIKGTDILMDACRLLMQQGLYFSVGIVGYPETWEYLDKNYPDLADCIIRLKPSENINQFYDSTGAFLSTSRRECFSYALLEALYKERPVIASNIVGNQWAHTFDTVAFFENEDATGLAQKMKDFLAGKLWYTAQSLKAVSDQVEKKYDCAVWAKRIEEIYCEK